MNIFNFFLPRTAPILEKRTGLIGHWKESDGASKESLQELIEQIVDGDRVTIVFRGEHVHHAAMTMFYFRRKFQLEGESLTTLLRGMLRHHAEKKKGPPVYTATVRLHSIEKYRKESHLRLYDKLNGYVIELRVVRGEEDQG